MDTGSKRLENLTTGSRRYATSDGRAKMKNGEGMDLCKQYVIERRVTRSLTRENRNVSVVVTDCVPTNDCSKRARVLSDEEKAKLDVNLSEQFARKAEKRVVPWPSRVTFSEHFKKGTNDSTECLNKVKVKESLPKQIISKFDNREWDAIMAGGDEKEGNGCKGKTLIHENRNRSRIEEEHSIVQGWTKEQDLALQRAYFTEKPAPHFWKKVIRMENRKYAKYKNMNCSEIYDMFGKLFGDTSDSTKYVMSPTKLSQREFDLGTDRDQEDEGDKLPINVEGMDSGDSPVEHRGHSSMNISKRHIGDKKNYRHGKDKGKRKNYYAREVSTSLEQMVNVGTDLVSSARSHQKDDMSIDECVGELLSSGHVEEGSPLHIFALWFLRVKENRSSYRAARHGLHREGLNSKLQGFYGIDPITWLDGIQPLIVTSMRASAAKLIK